MVERNVQIKIKEICGKIRKAIFLMEKNPGYCSPFDSDFQISLNFTMMKLANIPPANKN